MYKHAGQLAEPANDAKAIKVALEYQGFDVMVGYNLDRNNLLKLIGEFSHKFQKYKSGMVFYAGHGFQIDGENYLIPIDANPTSKWQVKVQCLNAEAIFESIDDPNKPKVIVLDACRNNPFSRSWSSKDRGGEIAGMNAVRAKRNSLIIFSTAEDTRVKDDNPFTELFSEEIKKGGCIYSILGKVSSRIKVYNKNQVIWQAGILERELCFGSVSATSTGSNDSDGDGLVDSVDNCPYKYGSIKNQGCPEPKEGTFTDSRDHQKYSWKRMPDGLKWMTKNLNYIISDSDCYDGNENNCDNYGRLYTWVSAQRACPKGWRLPDEDEWLDMAAYFSQEVRDRFSKQIEQVDGKSIEGRIALNSLSDAMWNECNQIEYISLINNGGSGFSATLGGGYLDERFDGITGNSHINIGEVGYYWSNEETTDDKGIGFFFSKKDQKFDRYYDSYKSSRYSCRCVQE